MIYKKIEKSIFSRDFATKFISADIRGLNIRQKEIINLIKAKELFKWCKNNIIEQENTIEMQEISIENKKENLTKIKHHQCQYYYTHLQKNNIFKKLLYILKSNSKAPYLKLHFSVMIYIGDYKSAMFISRNSIREIIALSFINKEKAISKLEELIKNKNIDNVKYYLLLCDLYIESEYGPDRIEKAYKNAILKFNNDKIILAYTRYLKNTNLKKAAEFLINLKNKSELIAYEESIILRKLNNNYMAYLYKIRNKYKSPLILQEIKYFENKKLDHKESISYGLFLFKKLLRSDCNKNGCCEECKNTYQFIKTDFLKYHENGDFLLLHYFVYQNLNIEKVYNHLDQRKGFYWPRLRRIQNFENKLEKGLKMAKYDMQV